LTSHPEIEHRLHGGYARASIEINALLDYVEAVDHDGWGWRAYEVVQKETPQQILQRLSSMTARCTVCHDMYRFSEER
jgi:hypothetical protein